MPHMNIWNWIEYQWTSCLAEDLFICYTRASVVASEYRTQVDLSNKPFLFCDTINLPQLVVACHMSIIILSSWFNMEC